MQGLQGAGGPLASIGLPMRKELKPVHEDVQCEVCGRTILKGERAEPYLVPGGERRLVCELCTIRADQHGWIREAAHHDLPAARARPEPRRGLLDRLRRRREDPRPDDASAPEPPPVFADAADGDRSEEAPVPDHPLPSDGPKDPRHVRAVPTNAEVKIERALELFNASEHTRTISGIARTLGEPWVSAAPLSTAPSEVTIVVAWELSWYRYRVDLGDADQPVLLVDKGEELSELGGEPPAWNGAAASDGRLAVGVG